MAIHFPAITAKLTRTGAPVAYLAPGSGSIGFSYWLRLRSAYTAARQYSAVQVAGAFATLRAVSATNDLALYVDGATTADTSATSVVLATNVWTHIAVLYQKSTTTWTLYANAVSQATCVVDMAGITFTAETLGGDSLTGTTSDFDIAYYRAWSTTGTGAIMTAARLSEERASPQAVHLTSLFADTPLDSTTVLLDSSSNGRFWTATGAVATATSPQLDPWKLHRLDLRPRVEEHA